MGGVVRALHRTALCEMADSILSHSQASLLHVTLMDGVTATVSYTLGTVTCTLGSGTLTLGTCDESRANSRAQTSDLPDSVNDQI